MNYINIVQVLDMCTYRDYKTNRTAVTHMLVFIVKYEIMWFVFVMGVSTHIVMTFLRIFCGT